MGQVCVPCLSQDVNRSKNCQGKLWPSDSLAPGPFSKGGGRVEDCVWLETPPPQLKFTRPAQAVWNQLRASHFISLALYITSFVFLFLLFLWGLHCTKLSLPQPTGLCILLLIFFPIPLRECRASVRPAAWFSAASWQWSIIFTLDTAVNVSWVWLSLNHDTMAFRFWDCMPLRPHTV